MKFLKKNQGDDSLLAKSLASITGLGILWCALGVIAYCIWTLDRGFDLSDEAYYLLLAMHPGSVHFYISGQQWLTSGLWQITNSLQMFRAVGLVVLLASSALLALGVSASCLRLGVLKNQLQSKRVIVGGSVVGAMLYASTINLSPCYNLLASAGAYAGTGLVLFGLNCRSIPQKQLFFIMAGCAIGAEALCKASAGASTMGLLIFV